MTIPNIWKNWKNENDTPIENVPNQVFEQLLQLSLARVTVAHTARTYCQHYQICDSGYTCLNGNHDMNLTKKNLGLFPKVLSTPRNILDVNDGCLEAKFYASDKRRMDPAKARKTWDPLNWNPALVKISKYLWCLQCHTLLHCYIPKSPYFLSHDLKLLAPPFQISDDLKVIIWNSGTDHKSSTFCRSQAVAKPLLPISKGICWCFYCQ